MTKTTALSAALLLLTGKAAHAEAPQYKTPAAWNACAKSAMERAATEARAEGRDPDQPGYWGSSMGLDVKTQACGPEPAPSLQQMEKDGVFAGCAKDPESWMWSGFRPGGPKYDLRPFYSTFSEEVHEAIAARCEAIFAKKGSSAKQPATTPKHSRGWRVTHFGKVVEGMSTVVIETDRDRRIKCAVVRDGEYVTAREVTVTAPVDEVTQFASGEEVKCWEKK